MDQHPLKNVIEQAIKNPQALESYHVQQAVRNVIEALDCGQLRVASVDKAGQWQIHTWIREAILFYFRLSEIHYSNNGALVFRDKIPVKQALTEQGIRVVPPGTVRYGAFLEPGCVVMPGYVNIGAYVGEGSMIDTWATVGSCAQIGKYVHLAGGVGIGGILEPVHAKPVIIEDHVFVGSRCVVVEGVHIAQGAVLGAGVILTQNTPIIDVRSKEEKITRGYVPPRSVLIPGQRLKTFPSGSYYLPCALLIGERQASTDEKTSLNQALRDFAIPT